ncbi:carboxypeptidase-like regulatory domain-containing protein [Flagellimonas eckloniae]|uniref:Carboxypeptidase-like regulatory domain-containing protein n=1 Tax=Flagellimonas eckloniae TaxID=346185 RepID=A0A0Q1DL18_9FLAO|nr:carboxypeptidase-like regulatory domain-containing protein [Allomuricauda eckloniae]KQC29602.1 hypothetical protein AAY42_06670 [Allomuricauda eckloniae]
MRFFLLVLLLPFVSFSQNIDFDGYVLDAKTNEPIPYVNISFLNTLKGTSSDEKGHYFLEIQKEFLEKDVHVSSLGYKDVVIKASDLFNTKLILLDAATFELEEVVVMDNLSNSQVLNPIGSNKITGGFNSSSTPWILALYFPNMDSSKKYVEKVTIFFRNNTGQTLSSSKFRLRLFNVDYTHKTPNDDLVQKSLILDVKKNQEYVSIDLSRLRIKVPKEGIYNGLEWLFIPSNWYKKINKNEVTQKEIWEDRFAPTFGGIYTKNRDYRFMVYGMGEWNDFTINSFSNQEKFIPAISLKISK